METWRGGAGTGVDEHVTPEVVGAPEGRAAVLTDVGFGAWRQAAAIRVQHHRLPSQTREKKAIRTRLPSDILHRTGPKTTADCVNQFHEDGSRQICNDYKRLFAF